MKTLVTPAQLNCYIDTNFKNTVRYYKGLMRLNLERRKIGLRCMERLWYTKYKNKYNQICIILKRAKIFECIFFLFQVISRGVENMLPCCDALNSNHIEIKYSCEGVEQSRVKPWNDMDKVWAAGDRLDRKKVLASRNCKQVRGYKIMTSSYLRPF